MDQSNQFKIIGESLKINKETINNLMQNDIDENTGTLLFNKINNLWTPTSDQTKLKEQLIEKGFVNNYPLLKQKLIALDSTKFSDEKFYPLWAYGLHDPINKNIFRSGNRLNTSNLHFALSSQANEVFQIITRYGKTLDISLQLVDHNASSFTINEFTYTINVFYEEQNNNEELVFKFNDNATLPINKNLYDFISSTDNGTSIKNIAQLIEILIKCNMPESVRSIIQNADAGTILYDSTHTLNQLQTRESEQLRKFYNEFLTKKLKAENLPASLTQPKLISSVEPTSVQQSTGEQNNVPSQSTEEIEPNNEPTNNNPENIENPPSPNNNPEHAQNSNNDELSQSATSSIAQILLSKKIIIPGIIIIGGTVLCFTAYKLIKNWHSKKSKKQSTQKAHA